MESPHLDCRSHHYDYWGFVFDKLMPRLDMICTFSASNHERRPYLNQMLPVIPSGKIIREDDEVKDDVINLILMRIHCL